MIVLTYIKLHQSAMRDIVLLVDHAIKKKKKKNPNKQTKKKKPKQEQHLSTLTCCIKSSVLQ